MHSLLNRELKIARAERKKNEEYFNSEVKPQLMTLGDRS